MCECWAVCEETICMDSTLIKSNASLDSFVEAKEVPKEFIKRVYQENDFEPAEPVVKYGMIGRHYNGKTDSSKIGRGRCRFIGPARSHFIRPGK